MQERGGETIGSGGLAAEAGSSPKPIPPLKAAVRRARIENAEQSQALDLLHGAEIARLELLQDALTEVVAELPEDATIFDVSLMRSTHPRLFIDMIAFVEMAHDKRLYRFIQDSRTGRITLAESERLATMVEAITDYIARRLVEREKALAADALANTSAKPSPPPAEANEEKRKPARGFRQIVEFCIELLGSMALFTLVAAGAYLILTWVMGFPALHP